ncbi:hypothetical protein IQ267_13805 [filamentous cyanobacterium LEGE 07170]|nr:hypothetical protein [filamentous cyanobacterium LEGE 07170]
MPKIWRVKKNFIQPGALSICPFFMPPDPFSEVPSPFNEESGKAGLGDLTGGVNGFSSDFTALAPD